MIKYKNINNYILVIIFIMLISLPPILYWGVKDYIEVDNSENRQLATKPEFNISTILSYPSSFDEYYNDNLPFRGIIRKNWANFKFLMFNDSVSGSVLIGKNDGNKSLTWLFYKSDWDGNPVRDAQGVTSFTDEEMENAKNNILDNIKKFEEKGIRLYYCVIPNKENIYKDMLPNSVEIINEESKTDRLAKYINAEDKILIYPKNELMNARNTNQTYWRQDTHWNSYGAFIGFKSIMNKINPEFDEFDMTMNISEEEVIVRDLTGFSGINGILKDKTISIDFFEEREYDINKLVTSTNVIDITECDEASIDETLLIIGDSYREAMEQYFSKVYKKVIYMHRNDYNKEMLEEYKPDVVLYETVERYSKDLQEYKLY